MRSLLFRQEIRSQVDHLLDRRPVEALQGVELSRTNDRRLARVVRGIVDFFEIRLLSDWHN